MQAVGDTTGLSIADFGCGTGVSTRLLATLGKPAKLVGIDYSAEMLALAKQAEENDPLGISYIQADCSKELPSALNQNFDLVTAMWLLHYAENKEMIDGFARSIYNTLRPGGHLITMVQDKFTVDVRSKRFGEYREWVDAPFVEASQQRVFLLDPEGAEICNILIRFWNRETYTKALEAAGFQDVMWTNLAFDQSLHESIPDWESVEEHASCSLLTARKP